MTGVPEGWEWDETLFKGSAAYYTRGRLPYPGSLPETFAAAAAVDLSGEPRLIDVGCGPGTVALMLAPLFHEAVGVDPDGDMVAEAARLAGAAGVTNARWVQLRAEELPAGLGSFRYATFAQSFHWMDRDRVARVVYEMLEPGGAFVHLGTGDWGERASEDGDRLRPPPPEDQIRKLCQQYLGTERRAGQGVLRHGTPG